MNIIVLDFETYFDKQYSLRSKKMTTESYVRDPRFEVHGLGVYADGAARWLHGLDLAAFVQQTDWRDTGVLAHHAHFDGLVLSHHFGVRPAFWLDTLSMGRHLFGNHLGLGLADLANVFGLAPKSMPYDKFIGRHWVDLDLAVRQEIAEGCKHDCELTFTLFKLMLGCAFPVEELRVIDMTVRMFTEPVLVGDVKHYAWMKEQEWISRNEILFELGITAKELRQNGKFAAILEAEGIDVEYKAGKNGPIPCFAKTDEQIQELLDDDNERVAALAAARLEVSSSIDETRAGRLEQMAQRGALTLYVKYCGAVSLRWSGGDKINIQNLGRSSQLRRGICAPLGCLLGVYDQKQIEARLLAYMAGQRDDLEAFASGGDPYLEMASRIYGHEVLAAETAKRGVGKQAILMCGYGAGWRRFQATALHGQYGPPVRLTDEEAQNAVGQYRETRKAVMAFWAEADLVLIWLKEKRRDQVWHDLVLVDNGCLILPNGSRMTYDLLWDGNYDRNGHHGAWRVKRRNGWEAIWGAKLVQNVMEALARLHLSQRMLDLQDNFGMRSVCTVHDENWVLHPCPDHYLQAQERHQTCLEVMAKVPAWAPGLPVAVEGHLGARYEK